MSDEHRVPVKYAGRQIHVAARGRLSSPLGSGTGELIVFMHGLGCAKESFVQAFEQERLRSYSIYTFDFPSHGGSDRPDADLISLKAYADLARLLIRRQAPRRVHLVCHSMGGVAGLILAGKLPNLGSFVSVEGNLVSADCGLISRTMADQPRKSFVSHGFRRIVDQLSASERLDLRQWARWFAASDPAAVHALARDLVRWSDTGNLIEAFHKLDNRAYVFGHRSHLDHLWPDLNGVPTYGIPGAGHFPMLDNPTSFYATLADILTDFGPRSRGLADATTGAAGRPG